MSADTQNLPLKGLKILVTRAKQQAGSFSAKLAQLGAVPVEIPFIQLAAAESSAALEEAISQLKAFDWIVFASANAVDFFVAHLEDRHPGHGTASNFPQVAAIGPATQRALEERGIGCSYRPSEFIAESFIKNFPGYPTKLAGSKILWPKANIGRLLIADELKAAGASVQILNCYTSTAPQDLSKAGAAVLQLIRLKQLDVITLASAQTARNLSLGFEECGGISAQELARIPLFAIGPETALAARRAFGETAQVHCAETFTIDGLIDALLRYRPING